MKISGSGSDVIEIYEKENLPGMLLFLDFEKAFDSLEWKFLYKVLEIFGPMFQQWSHTFYSNITTCVINNGYASDFFLLLRGVRQEVAIYPLYTYIHTHIHTHILYLYSRSWSLLGS